MLVLVLLVLRKAFDAFDSSRSGSIPTDMVADILRLMGQPFNKKILDELIEEVDADSTYQTSFDFTFTGSEHSKYRITRTYRLYAKNIAYNVT